MRESVRRGRGWRRRRVAIGKRLRKEEEDRWILEESAFAAMRGNNWKGFAGGDEVKLTLDCVVFGLRYVIARSKLL